MMTRFERESPKAVQRWEKTSDREVELRSELSELHAPIQERLDRINSVIASVIVKCAFPYHPGDIVAKFGNTFNWYRFNGLTVKSVTDRGVIVKNRSHGGMVTKRFTVPIEVFHMGDRDIARRLRNEVYRAKYALASQDLSTLTGLGDKNQPTFLLGDYYGHRNRGKDDLETVVRRDVDRYQKKVYDRVDRQLGSDKATSPHTGRRAASTPDFSNNTEEVSVSL